MNYVYILTVWYKNRNSYTNTYLNQNEAKDSYGEAKNKKNADSALLLKVSYCSVDVEENWQG